MTSSYFLIIFLFSLCSNNFIKRNSHDIFKKNHITYIESHRGFNKIYPQNTIPAFKEAINNSIDGIELDIWLTKDHVPVVVHGQIGGYLYNFYDTIWKINSLTLNEVKKLRTINGNEKMPTLEEVLIICKNRIFLNIEIKDKNINKMFPILINLLEKYNMINEVHISSFTHGYYKLIKKYNEQHENKIEFGFLYYPIFMINWFKFNYPNCSLNIYYKDVTKDLVEKAHKNGMAVLAWFKMNDEENNNIYKSLFDNGVDSIITNYPIEAKKFRDEYFVNLKYYK